MKPTRHKDITGQKFGRLTAIECVGRDRQRMALWKCRCECGNYIVTRGTGLRYGSTKSCGCLRYERAKDACTTHGLSGKRLYKIWLNMKSRCFNSNTPKFKNHGGRGITICKEWLSFKAFYGWAITSGYRDDLTLDRINNNGDYSPENCRWATYAEQALNSRNNHLLTHKGKTQPMTLWADEIGMKFSTLHARIADYGWTVEDALETPVRERMVRK